MGFSSVFIVFKWGGIAQSVYQLRYGIDGPGIELE